MAYSNSPSRYPRSPSGGVPFFNHFPKSFLRPYGKTMEAPDDERLRKGLLFGNCEWLQRPNVALSEMASSVNRNLELLEGRSQLLKTKKFQNVRAENSVFLANIAKFDSKECETTHGTTADLKKIVEHFLEEDEETRKFFAECVYVGGAMFTAGIQYMAAAALISNPEEYAQKMDDRGPPNAKQPKDPHFTKGKDGIRDLLKFLEKFCVKSNSAEAVVDRVPKRRNLLNELLGMEEQEPATKKSKKHKVNKGNSKKQKSKRSEETEEPDEEELSM